MAPARTCPQCGEALGARECADGTVWECARHGVRAWIFDAPSLAFVRPGARAAPAATGILPAPTALAAEADSPTKSRDGTGVAGPISPII